MLYGVVVISEPFKPKYLHRKKEGRDRFFVEFNEEERREFLEAQQFIGQHKDATAIKQLMRLGWLAISNQHKFMGAFRDIVFKNYRTNHRLGVSVENEIYNKIQTLKAKTGWKL